MTFMNIKEIIIAIFIFMPIITLIHEIGHACISKLFGCKIKKIVIGKGKTIVRLGFLEIRKIYFFAGRYEAYNGAKTRTGRVMVHIGGVLFNLFSILIVIVLISNEIFRSHRLLIVFINMSIYVIIACIIPITYLDGSNSDGKQIYHTIKYGESVFRKRKEKNESFK
ncbi:M50 family metallopeptidase [Sporosalibacterium faouarense]|uniref:M50 family metallopeptidase n=1 Tax=Sporosalibacterium faouarense TaxID=516123 RepID=UPI00141D5658|nr:site-2 protease family protein [Sporosalibacterium faouarense]MTI47892.1 hypothetical protein [Bacillota bacterium]